MPSISRGGRRIGLEVLACDLVDIRKYMDLKSYDWYGTGTTQRQFTTPVL